MTSLKDVAEAAAARQFRGEVARASKHRNVKVTIDGLVWDSKWEGQRYTELKLMQTGGLVKDLRWKVTMPLVVNDTKVADYIADFVFLERVPFKDPEEWVLVVEDAKGGKVTEAFSLKRRLLYATRGIKIRETRRRKP